LLLSAAGITFAVRVPGVDESGLDGEPAADYVLRIAEKKARAIPTATGEVALGADTVVVVDGATLGKPADAVDAVSMLERLAGRTHAVLTGWTLIGDVGERFGVEETFVTMRSHTNEELQEHVARVRPFDKAGAYALQEDDGWLVANVKGSRSNVMGLPLRPVIEALSELGIERSSDESRPEHFDEV
jgi:septum formation protein